MNTKTCTGCGETKEATTEFFHKGNAKYGFKSKCKVCLAKPVVYEFPASKTCTCCKKEFPATAEFFYKKKDGKYGLFSKCKVCTAEYSAEHKQKPEVKQRRRERQKERQKTDIQFKLKTNLRTRLWHALKGNTKSASTLELLGCSIADLKMRLATMFEQGMSWDNYGEWHIDHIIPIDSFDLIDPAQQRECFHFSNLQPLWAEDNRSKGAKLETVF